MVALKINFFASGDNAHEEAIRLEKLLLDLGRTTVHRIGGISQFSLRTVVNISDVRERVDALSLNGAVTISEEEKDDEMSLA